MEQKGNNPVAKIQMKDGGVMTVELYPDKAPNTVANFVELCGQGYYKGLIFHRVISGFMIQGGDKSGTGAGRSGFAIKGEFSSNGVANDLKHDRGVISMARTMVADSASSQFFIVHQPATHLDGQYAAFGKMIDGFDVLDAIAATPTGFQDRPKADQVIEDITVELNGYQPPKPVRVEE